MLHSGFRRKDRIGNSLVFDVLNDYVNYYIIFKYDPLLHSYLDSKVPVGIVIDYLEDNTDLIEYTMTTHPHNEFIHYMRGLYLDTTSLFDN